MRVWAKGRVRAQQVPLFEHILKSRSKQGVCFFGLVEKGQAKNGIVPTLEHRLKSGLGFYLQKEVLLPVVMRAQLFALGLDEQLQNRTGFLALLLQEQNEVRFKGASCVEVI